MYYSMELLTGSTLAGWLTENQPVNLAVAKELCRQLYDTLAYCHDQGFVHRDVKPPNIMVDASGHLTLMDFGLVASSDYTALTEAGKVLGTPRYMAPEILRGYPIDQACDVWAAGMIAYEIFCGHHPFQARTLDLLLQEILETPIAPVRNLRPDSPDEVVDVIDRSLSRDLRVRFPDARIPARMLRANEESFLAGGVEFDPSGEPTSAPDTSTPILGGGDLPSRRVVLRSWPKAAGALVLAVMLIAGFPGRPPTQDEPRRTWIVARRGENWIIHSQGTIPSDSWLEVGPDPRGPWERVDRSPSPGDMDRSLTRGEDTSWAFRYWPEEGARSWFRFRSIDGVLGNAHPLETKHDDAIAVKIRVFTNKLIVRWNTARAVIGVVSIPSLRRTKQDVAPTQSHICEFNDLSEGSKLSIEITAIDRKNSTSIQAILPSKTAVIESLLDALRETCGNEARKKMKAEWNALERTENGVKGFSLKWRIQLARAWKDAGLDRLMEVAAQIRTQTPFEQDLPLELVSSWVDHGPDPGDLDAILTEISGRGLATEYRRVLGIGVCPENPTAVPRRIEWILEFSESLESPAGTPRFQVPKPHGFNHQTVATLMGVADGTAWRSDYTWPAPPLDLQRRRYWLTCSLRDGRPTERLLARVRLPSGNSFHLASFRAPGTGEIAITTVAIDERSLRLAGSKLALEFNGCSLKLSAKGFQIGYITLSSSPES